MVPFGQQALLNILVNLLFVVITWWAIQGIQIERFIKKGRVQQARVLMILLTIAVSSLVSTFFLNYLSWSLQLRHLL